MSRPPKNIVTTRQTHSTGVALIIAETCGKPYAGGITKAASKVGSSNNLR
jgi:hypothetical protein